MPFRLLMIINVTLLGHKETLCTTVDVRIVTGFLKRKDQDVLNLLGYVHVCMYVCMTVCSSVRLFVSCAAFCSLPASDHVTHHIKPDSVSRFCNYPHNSATDRYVMWFVYYMRFEAYYT